MSLLPTRPPVGREWRPVLLEEGRVGSSAVVRQLVKEKENSEFKPDKLHLKIEPVRDLAMEVVMTCNTPLRPILG